MVKLLAGGKTKKRSFKICFWFVALINKLRNLRCFDTLGSLLRWTLFFYFMQNQAICNGILL